LPKIEEDEKSWLRRPKLYKGVVEPYKIRRKYSVQIMGDSVERERTVASKIPKPVHWSYNANFKLKLIRQRRNQ
jgi:hypothetical protein